MEREKELKEVKRIIKEYFNEAYCGLFNRKSITLDPTTTIFKGKFFKIDISYYYSYFEVFGTTEVEFSELSYFYNKLRR